MKLASWKSNQRDWDGAAGTGLFLNTLVVLGCMAVASAAPETAP